MTEDLAKKYTDDVELKKKFTPAYAEYQKYLEEVLADEPTNKTEGNNEIQDILRKPK
jgi:hypothetical protein